MFEPKRDVAAAENLIRHHIRETPLDYSVALSQTTGANLYLKCENLQYTNAFKVRGAFNKLLNLSGEQKRAGIVTASSGNHGAAVAMAASKLGIKASVFLPENASSTKVANIRHYHANLAFHGNDCMQTELHALQYAKDQQMTYVSPYNDLQVIAGQGTIGLELSRQLARIDSIFIPIGGGGLIAGIAGYLKAVSPHTKIIGCMPVNSPVMAESIKAQRIIDMVTLPTLSDATAGGIEPEAITLALCQQYVDDYVLVTEDEIKNAILLLIKTHRLLGEGASGVALASFLQTAHKYANKNVVVLLSGGNISLETLSGIITRENTHHAAKLTA